MNLFNFNGVCTMSETIAAIATGDVLSAIGIIRVSGDEALTVVNQVFRALSGTSVLEMAPRKLYYGDLLDETGAVLDKCLCTVSHAPASFTGEHTAELQCHGSPVVLRAALERLCTVGARLAGPGEFTKRAFLNGKMDLVQAEAVMDLISAQTDQQARNAAGQLAGAVTKATDAIYDGLTDIMAHFHAVLDYPDEDIEPFQLAGYRSELSGFIDRLHRLEESFDRGRILKDGVRCVILGRPNAGKSSLLNALLGYERAIVTDIPGTTRDTLEEQVRLGNILLRLTDTAGLRDATDPIERMGVERSKSAAQGAELLLAIFDGSAPLSDADSAVLVAAAQSTRAVAIINKGDLPQRLDLGADVGQFAAVCQISAKTGAGLDTLADAVSALFEGAPVPAGEILTNVRHHDAVRRARASLESADTAIEAGLTPDAVLTDIESAMSAIGELTGKTLRADITARIFERFCVGK